VRRKMHILDVISSVSRSSKCTKIAAGWIRPRLNCETYSTPPDPLAGLKGPTSKALLLRGWEERVGRGTKKIIVIVP